MASATSPMLDHSPGRTPLSTLDRVAAGATVHVADVAGDDEMSLRLLEMGLTPGVAVRMVGRAPLGDPLELELRGYRLSLRRTEAARVSVERS